MKGQTILFSLRLPKSLHNEISRIAKRDYRTLASVGRQAIKEFSQRDKEREERK